MNASSTKPITITVAIAVAPAALPVKPRNAATSAAAANTAIHTFIDASSKARSRTRGCTSGATCSAIQGTGRAARDLPCESRGEVGMRRFRIEHRTVYRYARPVAFGPHRLLLRPKEGPDVRVVRARVAASPLASLRWSEDALGNVVAHATFAQRARVLAIESTVEVEHSGDEATDARACAAITLPVGYHEIEQPDLARTRARHHPDPHGQIDAWARRFLRENEATPVLEALERMATSVRDELRWEPRDEEGTQTPIETLARGVGACRDFALLVIEACRSLGLAARFVSGYLYDPSRDVDPAPPGGATHAWVQVYLPGTGWLELDPTHGRIGSTHLVRVAVARDPASLAPITGTWIGFPGDALGMEVCVHVRELAAADESGTRRLPPERISERTTSERRAAAASEP